MTDIVFLLLIFFIIVSSVVKDPALKLVLPKGTPDVNPVNQVITISIDQNLNYSIGDRIVSLDRLPSALQQELRDKPDATVSIRGDKNVKYENVMDIVLLANRQNAKVVLALDQVK